MTRRASNRITLRQVRVFVGKWRAGYRPGDEGWSTEDQQVYRALVKVRYAARDFFGRIICRFKGHHYPARVIRGNCLYFCTRCRAEMFGRTLADLRRMPPMSDEDLEDWKRDCLNDEARA